MTLVLKFEILSCSM